MEFIDLKHQYKKSKEKINAAIHKVLDHGRYINGPEIVDLEKDLCDFSGAKHAVACANGTDALSLCLMALGVKEGDEIISTSFTFFATAETIALTGAKLVFVDIDPNTYNIDVDKIEEKITSRTKAILPVSLYGQCPDLEKINLIAKKHNLVVIEDAAQSFGAEFLGKKSCSMTTLATTSFFPAKPLGCYGDGGAVFTNDELLAQKVRELRNHGQSKRYTHTSIGLNSRLDTLQAAILIEKLKLFPREVELRNEVAKRYNEALDGIVKINKIDSRAKSVYAQYTIEVDERDAFIKKMKDYGVPTAVHYPVPIHKQPIFNELGYKDEHVPNAEHASNRVVSIPMHPYLSKEDQGTVIQAIKNSLGK